jgi:tRNA pseudouridine38-40 synthase
MAASRTDTGVHAAGQVVSFWTGSALPLQTFVKGLNYYLADDIAVKEAFRTGESFNVRRDAVSREYNYYILNSLTRSPLRGGRYHLVSAELDIGAIGEACGVLIGEHDFASFAPESETGIRDTVRQAYQAGAKREADMVVLNMVANSFLRHQVRNTVGALIQVGQGKMTVSEFEGILEARRPGLAGPRAPASGLCLMRVNYPAPFGEMFAGDTE